MDRHADRHSANYFVEIKGDDVKVTGIANDFCFGKDQKALLNYAPDKGIASSGQPALIDRKTHVVIDTTEPSGFQIRRDGGWTAHDAPIAGLLAQIGLATA